MTIEPHLLMRRATFSALKGPLPGTDVLPALASSPIFLTAVVEKPSKTSMMLIVIYLNGSKSCENCVYTSSVYGVTA